VVVVLVEHGGHGGSAAAPLAREVMEEYFSNRPPVQEAKLVPATGSGQQAARRQRTEDRGQHLQLGSRH
jgi:hypothetical protein